MRAEGVCMSMLNSNLLISVNTSTEILLGNHTMFVNTICVLKFKMPC